MSGTTKAVCGLFCLAVALTAPAVRADIPPPDVTCDSKGSACDNAAPNGFGDGVCTTGVPTTAFGRPSCGPAGEAGEAGAAQTECLFCDAAGGSAGNSGGAAGSGTAGTVSAAGANTAAGASSKAGAAGAATAGAKSSDSSSSDNDGGCSVRQLGSERGIAIFMLGLGISALALGRRRR